MRLSARLCSGRGGTLARLPRVFVRNTLRAKWANPRLSHALFSRVGPVTLDFGGTATLAVRLYNVNNTHEPPNELQSRKSNFTMEKNTSRRACAEASLPFLGT